MKTGFALAAAAGSLALSSFALSQNTGDQPGLGTPLALTLSGSAQQVSQQGDPAPPMQPSVFTVRGGVLFPIQDGLADRTYVLLGLGVDYTFSNAYVHNGETFVSVDWLARTRGSTRLNLFPVNINERFYVNDRATSLTTNSYFFVGLGATLFDYSSSTFRFGGRAGYGAELGPHWVAEAAVYLSTADHGIEADAVGVYLGYKFGG